MGLKKYVASAFSSKKYNSKISILSFWDNRSLFSKKVFIGAFARLNNAQVGDYTRIKPLCNIFNAKIGRFCSIAKGVKIGLGMHPTNLISTNSIFYKSGIRTDWCKDIGFVEEDKILIGNDVWIGIEAIVMDGVTVGDGAIIAARSVVTKDIPPFAIVGGVPARIIRYRFDEETISELMKIRWWNYDDLTITNNLKNFTEPNLTAEKIRRIFKNGDIA